MLFMKVKHIFSFSYYAAFHNSQFMFYSQDVQDVYDFHVKKRLDNLDYVEANQRFNKSQSDVSMLFGSVLLRFI